MPAPYTGRCLCGDVHFRVTAEPWAFYACHCTDCQRRTGSAFGLSMIVKRVAVELLQGSLGTYSATLHDGRVKAGQLCAQCGSRVWGTPKSGTVLVVQAGLLDAPHGLVPVAHQWMSEAQPWVVLPDGVPRYDKSPAEPMEMARLWREAHPQPPITP